MGTSPDLAATLTTTLGAPTGAGAADLQPSQSSGETLKQTSLDKFEQPNPEMVNQLKFLGEEKLGRKIMFGEKHVGQILPSSDNKAAVILDNGLILIIKKRINYPEDLHKELKYQQGVASEEDMNLAAETTRLSILKGLRLGNDDILGLDAEFVSANNEVGPNSVATMTEFTKSLDIAYDKFLRRLPKNVNEVAAKIASLHRDNSTSYITPQLSPSTA